MKPTFLKTSTTQFVNLNEIRCAIVASTKITLHLSTGQVIETPRFRLANLESFVRERYNTVTLNSKSISYADRTRRSRKNRAQDAGAVIEFQTASGETVHVFPKGVTGVTFRNGELHIATIFSPKTMVPDRLFKLEEAVDLFGKLGLITEVN